MANQHLDTPWTDERVEELKRLWAEGYSATEIVEGLKMGVTRSGVLGKVMRLGLPKRKSPEFKPGPPGRSRGQAPRPRKPIMRRAVFIAPVPQPAPPPPVKSESRKLSVMGLLDHHCRWPTDGPPDTRFCGAFRQSGDPYCRYHMRKAFAKPRTP